MIKGFFKLLLFAMVAYIGLFITSGNNAKTVAHIAKQFVQQETNKDTSKISFDHIVTGFFGFSEKKENKASTVTGTIVSVTDGDTFKVKIGKNVKTVRLIGVDTPESVARNNKLVNTDWGKKASKYTKSILKKGTTVILEYDSSKTDMYGRDLAYVYYGKNKTMVQKTLLNKGYARAVYYKPNGKYRNTFKNLHVKAKKKKVGFWKDGFKKAFPTKKETDY